MTPVTIAPVERAARVAGIAALLTTVWSIAMFVLLTHGPARYSLPHAFSHDIDSPVLAVELAYEPSDVDAVLHRKDPNPANAAIAERALRLDTILDLVFIPLYAVYLIALATLVGWARRWIRAAVIAAALFDYVEDVFIFATLRGAAPLELVPSLIKWAFLSLSLLLLGIGMLGARVVIYSFATRAMLGILHLGAGALIMLGVALGESLGYSWIELGTTIFGLTVLANLVGLLGPTVAGWFPGRDIVYVDDFCAKKKRGLTSGPAVRDVSRRAAAPH